MIRFSNNSAKGQEPAVTAPRHHPDGFARSENAGYDYVTQWDGHLRQYRSLDNCAFFGGRLLLVQPVEVACTDGLALLLQGFERFLGKHFLFARDVIDVDRIP